jgi:hypothetical protein
VHIAIQALADIAQNGTSEAAPNSAPLHGIPAGPFDDIIGSW